MTVSAIDISMSEKKSIDIKDELLELLKLELDSAIDEDNKDPI